MKNVNQKKLINFRLSVQDIEKLDKLAKKYRVSRVKVITKIINDKYEVIFNKDMIKTKEFLEMLIRDFIKFSESKELK